MSSEKGKTPPDQLTLQLLAEHLVVSRRQVPGDTLRVSTVTREIEHSVDEALTSERIEVERVPIGRIVQTMPEVREEDGVTIVPVVEETIVVERRWVLKEEIRITKRRVDTQHVETVILRQQDALISRTPPFATAVSLAYQPIDKSKGESRPMTQETIVAIYDTEAHAASAVRDLEAAHVPSTDISQHAKAGSLTGTSRTTAPVQEKGFWASIFGGETDHDTSVYGKSIESGATVVTVKVVGERYDEVAAILEKHNPVDVDERSAQYGLSNTSTTGTGIAGYGGKVEPAKSATEAGAIGASGLTPAPTTNRGTGLAATAVGLAEGAEGGTLQLAEEFLNVGKRAVRGGTTRIRRYTVEKPVEENVTLHSEKVLLDRRPVTDGRVLANADFTDKTISMTETNEEAVVSKTARVVEEVGLRKEASDRVETVRDTLRKDEVEVKEDPILERFETSRTTPVTKPVDRKI